MNKTPPSPKGLSSPPKAGFTRGEVLGYVFMPQIIPRMRKLAGSGFPRLAYFIATVFNTLGILPGTHPYLRPDMYGRYSPFQAMGAAASHIPFNRKNIDKIAIFTIILSGLVMLVLQFVLWVLALFASPAYAGSGNGPGLGPRTLADLFDNEAPKTDLAFNLLDLVFGVQGVFGSNAEGATALHKGLHTLFEFYSYGILLVGCLVIIYMTAAIVMETAKTGVPFGQRFTKPWAPIRLILFFALLIPLASGLNLAQYVVLNAAKFGSNLSTNAWITFHEAAKAPYLGREEDLIARPNIPDLNSFLTFMAMVQTCAWGEGRVNGQDIQPYMVYKSGKDGAMHLGEETPAFTDMVEKARAGALFFRFGVQDENLYGSEPGAVYPYCGEVSVTITDRDQPGAAVIQQAYIEMIACLWDNRAGDIVKCNYAFTGGGGRGGSSYTMHDLGEAFVSNYAVITPQLQPVSLDPFINPTAKSRVMLSFSNEIETALDKAIEKQLKDGEWSNVNAKTYGWAGAGIWFNKIAEMNGAITAATYNVPQIKTLPYVMDYIRNQKLQHDQAAPLDELYSPYLSSGRLVDFESPQQLDVARPLYELATYWGSETAVAFIKNAPETHNQGMTGNAIIDTINTMMGTRGLFDMCKNANIHPLAQLSSLGRGLIEHSIRGFAVAAGIGVAGGLAGLLDDNIGGALKGATSFFLTFASLGLMLGFILFYVLPFIPFIYFFFAVMTWVKSIFEAMVGVPLWALAHLKIDGEGMPGDSATVGYFHILEIFLRPILILIGFIGAIIIYTASVKVLNSIFYLVLSNLSGHYVTEGLTECFQPPKGSTAETAQAASGQPLSEAMFKRGVIDEFFYTVVYTIIVFLMAVPCFKLVDLIPDYAQRWLGSGVTPFGAQDGDPADNMIMYVSMGAGGIGGKLEGLGGAFGFRS
ncbi:MAG: DotA/TraY family protein [Micavibrio sp.]